MRTPPAGIPDETWDEAVRAGFHATSDASRSEVAEILAAAMPVLQQIPQQPDARRGRDAGHRLAERVSR
jgi:hypothetical protein